MMEYQILSNDDRNVLNLRILLSRVYSIKRSEIRLLQRIKKSAQMFKVHHFQKQFDISEDLQPLIKSMEYDSS